MCVAAKGQTESPEFSVLSMLNNRHPNREEKASGPLSPARARNDPTEHCAHVFVCVCVSVGVYRYDCITTDNIIVFIKCV